MMLIVFVWLHGIGKKFVTDLHNNMRLQLYDRRSIVWPTKNYQKVIRDFQDQEDNAANQRNCTYTGAVKH